MKLLILLLLTLSSAWAKPMVLISYYDAFNQAPFNNSEKVAKALAAQFGLETSEVDVRLCLLNTIYEKSYAQTEECLKALPQKPVMVLGLGESTCDLKFETVVRNTDHTYGPDNAGNSRNNAVIIPQAPLFRGLRYPLPQMYCALTQAEKNSILLSNDAGTFVCNNTAFQLSHYYPEIQYGFVHVPAHNCRNLDRRTQASVAVLSKMIKQGVSYLTGPTADQGLPHTDNHLRLSTKRAELQALRNSYASGNQCLGQYLRTVKAVDERRSFFGFQD